MEVFRTGTYHIDNLEDLQEFQPLEFAKKFFLKRLDYLIGYLKINKPEIVQKFIFALNGKFVQLISGSYSSKVIGAMSDLNSEFENLKAFPELLLNSLTYYLQLLKIDINSEWTSEEVKIPNRIYIRSFLYHRYYNALALTEVMERENAISLFKAYITAYVRSLSTGEARYDTLEDFRNARIPKEGDSPNIGWEIVHGKIENGKYPQRKDTCMWDDAIQDLPDIELRYLAACYGDYQSYNNLNANFILTMEHTIVAGDPYCSCITHDTRIDWNLTHPPKEYWDNIWPLQEWQRKK